MMVETVPYNLVASASQQVRCIVGTVRRTKRLSKAPASPGAGFFVLLLA